MKIVLERTHQTGEVERIEVTLDAWGNLEATVQGVQGPRCGEVSAFLDELGVVTEDSPTADYYAAVTEANWDYLGGPG